MNKKDKNKLVRRQEHIISVLTDDQDEYLDMLEEFYDISLQLNKLKITNDETRDIAIRCVDKLIELDILSEEEHNFEIQDLIQDEINNVLGLDIDDNFEITTKN